MDTSYIILDHEIQLVEEWERLMSGYVLVSDSSSWIQEKYDI